MKEKAQVKPNLIVLYAEDRPKLRDELAALGLMFEEHQHGNGPIHDACEVDGFCLEIYPTSETNPPTHTRLGLSVSSMEEAMIAAESIGANIKLEPKDSPWGMRAVIQLQTGTKVELIQPN